MEKSNRVHLTGQRINALDESLKKLQKDVKNKEYGIPMVLIFALSIPIIAFITFYLLNPVWLQKDDENGNKIRNNSRIILSSLGVALLVWTMMYFYTRYKGYDPVTWLCSK